MPSSEIALEKQLDLEAFPEKAALLVLEKATVSPGCNQPEVVYEKNEKIAVQFNPTEFSLSANSNLLPETDEVVTGGKTLPKLKEKSPNSLSVKFLYDAAIDLGSVVRGSAPDAALTKFRTAGDLGDTCLQKFRGLARQTNETGRPPLLCFFFGSTSFVGYVSSLTIQCTRFDKLGKILRAEISLQMEEAKKGDALPEYKLPAKKTNWTDDANPPATLADLLGD